MLGESGDRRWGKRRKPIKNVFFGELPQRGQVGWGGPINPLGGREEVPRVIPSPESSLVESASGTSCSVWYVQGKCGLKARKSFH